MKIDQLFERDIRRNINGVIKVGQQDSENVRQELDEYVVTKELDKHFHDFFERYTTALGTPTDKMGVWISGFFGSGKSHFLKILSYLLANEATSEGKQAADYFDEKRISDALLRASINQAANASTDVILFNIDSKADSNSKREKDSIVKVFQKVFDEHLGYFGTDLAIANFERTLDQKNQYQSFKQAFQEASGQTWEEGRDAWMFNQDDIVTALQASTSMTEESANRLVENYDKNSSLSPEQFACTVRQYLESKGSRHQLVFMVDEVGQYIGDNTDLMLNLQTVVEDLGVHCHGRAWVLVTSQEAIDEITKNRVKGNDFSKIVGRFYRPLSLSSSNTDEVIKLRLLNKGESCIESLKALYDDKQAILKNQIAFTQDSAELPGYRNADEFAQAYPFIPYQFTLLQKVFTQVRLMGSSGKHLASGERSLLDAFQIAAKAVADESLGVLVPFHTFYLAIEGFLDSVVSQVIAQAQTNAQLQPFDVDLLKTLFMVKYVKEVSANLDNLTTLSLKHIDQDKNQLKADVEASLARLEKQTLIQRAGDAYSFLTNEEQDIGKEIKNTEINPDEVTQQFQRMIWETIFPDKKLKFSQRHQYGFNRKLDDQALGQQVNDFGLHVITPYADRYQALQEDTACLMSVSGSQEVLVRLPDDSQLLDEVNELVKTDKYIRTKNSGTLTTSIQQILNTRRDENIKRQERIVSTLRRLLSQADVFAANSKVDISQRDAKTVLTEGLMYLVENVYTKLNYVQSGFEKDDDVTNAFTRDSAVQLLDGEHPNGAAHQEMMSWLNSERRSHRRVTMRDLVNHFTIRPYGWSELDTFGILAELVNLGKAEMRQAQATVNAKERGLIVKLRSKQGMDSYLAQPCDEVDPGSLAIAKRLGSDGLLSDTPPSDAVKLYETYQEELKQRCELLHQWKTHAEQENLPFVPQLNSSLELLQNLLASDGMAVCFMAMKEQREAIEDYIEDSEKLGSFFNNQLPLFKQARNDIKQLEPELTHLSDVALQDKVQKARQILAMDDPTGSIPQLRTLLVPVQEATNTLRQGYVAEVQQAGQSLKEKLSQYVVTTHSAVAGELDVALLTQPITQKLNALSAATTIDSTLARKGEIQALEARLYQEIDRAAAQIIEQKTPIPHVEGGGDPPPVVIPQKPIVAVRVASKAPQQVLESEADVEAYLAALRLALMAEINQDKRVRVE